MAGLAGGGAVVNDDQTLAVDMRLIEEWAASVGKSVECVMGALAALASPEIMKMINALADVMSVFDGMVVKESESDQKRRALDDNSIRSRLRDRDMRQRARGRW